MSKEKDNTFEECYQSINGHSYNEEKNDSESMIKINDRLFAQQSYFSNEYFYKPFEKKFNVKLKEFCNDQPIYIQTTIDNTSSSSSSDAFQPLPSLNSSSSSSNESLTDIKMTDINLISPSKSKRIPKKTTNTTSTTNTTTITPMVTRRQSQQLKDNEAKKINLNNEKSENDKSITSVEIDQSSQVSTSPSPLPPPTPTPTPLTSSSSNIEIFKPNQIPARPITKKPLSSFISSNSNIIPKLTPTTDTPTTPITRKLPSISKSRNSIISTPSPSSSTSTTSTIITTPTSITTNDNNNEFDILGEMLSHDHLKKSTLQQQQQNINNQKSLPHNNIYNQIDQDIENQYNEILLKKIEKVKNYPRYYQQKESIDMSTMLPISGDPILIHQGTSLQIGKCMVFDRIALNTDIPIINKSFYQNDNNDNNNNQLNSNYWKKRNIPTVSNDPNIMELVEKQNIDLVMSSSSFIKLINNHAPSFVEEWEIPTITKEYKSSNTGDTKTVVILDKPFLKKRITNREKNEKMYNLAMESFGLTLGKKIQPIDLNPQKTKEKEKEKEKEENEEQDNFFKEYLENSNLIYNVWKFGDLKILTRCKIHAYIPDKSTKIGFRYVGVKTRVEYQPERGFEDLTTSDISKWWSYNFLRPDAHLIFSRVNIKTNKLLTIEVKDMASILGSTTKFNPKRSSKIVLELLKKCRSLPIGNHLLLHNSNQHFVHIYKEIDGTNLSDQDESIYDLYNQHLNLPQLSNDLPIITIIPRNQLIKPILNNVNNNNNIGNNMVNQQPPQLCILFAENGQCKKPNTCQLTHLTIVQIKEKGLIDIFNNQRETVNKYKNKRKQPKQKKKKQSKKQNNNNHQQNNNNNNDNNNNEHQTSYSADNDLSYINNFI